MTNLPTLSPSPIYDHQYFELSLPPEGRTDADLHTLLHQSGICTEQAEQIASLKVVVIASWPKSQPALVSDTRLWLSYYLSTSTTPPHLSTHSDKAQPTECALAEILGWGSLAADQAQFRDYLWQKSCLECFIGGQGHEYIEINASPDGHYALYHFEDYRSPKRLPPRPLTAYLSTSDPMKLSSNLAKIQWQIDASSLPHDLALLVAAHSPIGGSAQACVNTDCARHFSFDLMQLPSALLPMTHLHPCVILYAAGIPLYFAPHHAPEPDFHNRTYWRALS